MSAPMMNIQAGDWVRFYQSSKLVIAIVQYVRPNNSWERSKVQVCTDIGMVPLESVIECRSGRGIETTVDPYYLARLRAEQESQP